MDKKTKTKRLDQQQGLIQQAVFYQADRCMLLSGKWYVKAKGN